ncbi:ABC transporter substrate-binding protein [Algoriphagus sp. AK58]|uniref:ABC transporter substrate-binding protein n=1 Tax=Algoriphagus sp. AK58 TaxID=1406877 RepID=UPI00164FDD75|nr:ABC transporter substrate-binding protein [Algoriphagus sp. AK58]MBC6368798.1 amino acid ABC transporter substrate-binding protein [Algoriphagus sp. AK58]
MRRILLILSLFFVLANASAQNLPDNYLKAKSALSTQDYWSAINLFKEFLDEDKYGNLSYYSAFHTAEAALKVNQPALAIETLRPVFGKSWGKSDELNYLLSIAYFQNGQALDGLRMIKQIKNEEILAKAYNVSFAFLKTETPNFLVVNLEEFKTNEGYTAALALVLQQKTVMSASERMALNQVLNTGGNNIVKDQVLDLVVILPFTSSQGQRISSLVSNDFMVELHQGIKISVDQLTAQGVQINLNTFDSKRDLNHLNTLLKDPAVLAADVIIGPIYPDESELVSAFAEAQKIPFIHPLSNLGERFEQTEFSYLFRPSVASLSKGVVSALNSQNWGKSVAIGFSGSARDERMAQLLQEELTQAGFRIAKSQKVDPKSVASFLQGLGVRRGNNPDVNQVILLTDDPAIAQPVFALMESISTSVPLLVMDSWLGFNFANYEMLEFPNFYFISNNTPKFESEDMVAFKKAFYDKYLAYPSLNVVLGAELVNWVSANAQFINNFDIRKTLDQKTYQPGKLTWGFNFRDTNNNTYSPVFKLESGELIPLK